MSRFIKKALEKSSKMDKTQLTELLHDLEKEHELYEASLNSFPGGIVVLDPEFRILFHNKAAERLAMIKSEPMSDLPVWDMMQDDDSAQFVRHCLEQDEPVQTREFAFDQPGGLRILSFSVLPLVLDGSIRGSMILVQDVSERKGRESRLRRAESLASLTTLAAGVAHEIKNPLGSIGIHIQLIQRALKNKSEKSMESINHDLGIINEEIDRLNGIVVDFLFAVRPMDTKLLLGSPKKVIEETVDFLHHELEQSNIRTLVDLTSGNDVILMDERFLKQALLNIIKNSMHAMEEGGTLSISTVRTKENLVLRVTDTGKGIPEDLLEKIFEPYFTTKNFGSGLGLTLVYKIVKEHGADIRVTSKVEVGTTVTILFPWPKGATPLLDFKGDEP